MKPNWIEPCTLGDDGLCIYTSPNGCPYAISSWNAYYTCSHPEKYEHLEEQVTQVAVVQ